MDCYFNQIKNNSQAQEFQMQTQLKEFIIITLIMKTQPLKT